MFYNGKTSGRDQKSVDGLSVTESRREAVKLVDSGSQKE
jgi:hypothetical protein